MKCNSSVHDCTSPATPQSRYHPKVASKGTRNKRNDALAIRAWRRRGSEIHLVSRFGSFIGSLGNTHEWHSLRASLRPIASMYAYSGTSRGDASWRESIFTHKKKNPLLPEQIPLRKSMTRLHEPNFIDNQNPDYKEMFEWGFSKIPRKISHYALMQNPNALAVWVYLINHAMSPNQHTKYSVSICGKTHWLEEGQLTTGIYKIESAMGVKAKTVWRILKRFESENLIEMRGTNRFSLITLKNSHLFKRHENQNENQKRNSSEADENSSKRVKEDIEKLDKGLEEKILNWFEEQKIGNPKSYLSSIIQKGATPRGIKKAWNNLLHGYIRSSHSEFYGDCIEQSKLLKKEANQSHKMSSK